jgi:hypothetical protein
MGINGNGYFIAQQTDTIDGVPVFASENLYRAAAISSWTRTRERRQASGTAQSFSLDQPQTAGAQSAANIAYLSGIDALIALQGNADRDSERRGALATGRNVLDMLDELRIALLGGSVPPHWLKRLAGALSPVEPETQDPALADLLRAIRLRAHVELAKLGHTPADTPHSGRP